MEMLIVPGTIKSFIQFKSTVINNSIPISINSLNTMVSLMVKYEITISDINKFDLFEAILFEKLDGKDEDYSFIIIGGIQSYYETMSKFLNEQESECPIYRTTNDVEIKRVKNILLPFIDKT